jgi:hypothetical protein
MRAAVSVPLDLYIESADPLGGIVRDNELGDLVTVGAPLYAKFGLRNAQAVYPERPATGPLARVPEAGPGSRYLKLHPSISGLPRRPPRPVSSSAGAGVSARGREAGPRVRR